MSMVSTVTAAAAGRRPRDTTLKLKVLGVTFNSNLSASLRRTISAVSSATVCSVRVLRHHGMNDVGLQTVFRAVVVSMLTYASPAWRGFIAATDLQRVDAFLRRSKRAAATVRLISRTFTSCWKSLVTGCSQGPICRGGVGGSTLPMIF